MNILEHALEMSNGDNAVALVQDALGIADGDIAGYSLPKTWPDNRVQRARCLAEWLRNELIFASDDTEREVA